MSTIYDITVRRNPPTMQTTSDTRQTGGTVDRRATSACWRGRPIDVAAGSWRTLCDALPNIETEQVTNLAGDVHPLEDWAVLRWPDRGPLTDADRAAWSGSRMATCRERRIVQPGALARALRAELERVRGRGSWAETRWELDTSWLGEWLRLRASWPAPDAAPPEQEAEAWVAATLRTEAGTTELMSGWRVRDGTDMIAYREPVLVDARCNTLDGCAGGRAMAAAVARAESGTARLASWSRVRVDASTLAQWARESARLWHPATLAGTLRQLAAEPYTPTLQQIGWRLGALLDGTRDIETRIEQQAELREQLEELESWNDLPIDLADTPAAAGTGTVH